MRTTIREIAAQTEDYMHLLAVADQLNQARYVPAHETYADWSILLGAFTPDQCVGFLRFLIQVIGRDQHRPPILDAVGQPLRPKALPPHAGMSPLTRSCVFASSRAWPG